MKRWTISLLGSATILALGSGSGAAERSAPSEPATTTPPGEGVLCAWGVITAAAEVADRCFPDEAPALRADLRQSVARFDAYVAANDSQMTPEAMARFKFDQAGVGAPVATLCKSEGVGFYWSIQKAGPDKLREIVDRSLARPGKPTWGDCF